MKMSNVRDAIVLLIFAVISRSTLPQSIQTYQFEVVFIGSTVTPTCAADDPDKTVSPVRSPLTCSKKCSEPSSECEYFNYRTSGSGTGSCQLYHSRPSCYYSSQNCKLYAKKNGIADISTPTLTSGLPAQICSFPFTSAGQLCYNCVANTNPGSSVCDVGCYLRNRTWVTCSPDTRAFKAENLTVLVTIPTGPSPTALRGVNGWIVIQSRVDSSYPVNLMWNGYVNSFGNSSSGGNFWLGLENMHQLTSGSGVTYRVRFELQAAANGKWFSVEYSTFVIDSAYSNYAIHVSTAGIGDAGDAFNYYGSQGAAMNNMEFTTRDRDNDNFYTNCATRYDGGWWYNWCMYGNLNADSRIGWFYWHPFTDLGLSPTDALMTSRMMITSL